MYSLIRPLLFLFDPEMAHKLTLTALKWLPKFLFKKIAPDPVQALGLTFPNRIGISAGLDSNGDYIDAIAKLGAGFIEVGGVTPKPQSGNPKPRLFRLPQQMALINRMGFANKGVDYLVERLKHVNYKGIIGVNIAKNKETSLEDSARDYIYCLRAVYPYASYVTVNISSPNTPGLRELQSENYLANLLIALKAERDKLTTQYQRHMPLVLKLSPDLTDAELKQIAATLTMHPIEGVIATNTTIDRNSLRSELHSNETGGLSGAPLTDQATQILTTLSSLLPTSISLIGVGGIMNAQDAQAKFSAGAKLIQLYTGLIYQGPGLIADISELK